jgi:hypothetical protein
MAKAPPPFKPTPAAPKNLSAGAAFDQFVKAHPSMKGYADGIWKWSKQYGVPAVVLAALLWRESFAEAKRRGVDPRTIFSPTGEGFGLAQINPKVWFGKPNAVPWFAGPINQEWASNPSNAIRFAAWYLSEGFKDTGNWDRAYDQHYNPGYTGPGLTSTLPKGYVPKESGLSPSDKASVSVEASTARQDITDPYAMLKNGKLVGTNNPKAAIKSFGAPVRMSDFQRYWASLNDNFIAYTGRRATANEAVGVLRKGTTEYQLINDLTKTPEFLKSPVWKSKAPSYGAVWSEVFGQDSTPDAELVRQAIVNNWDGTTFQAQLRKKPEYLKSKEFIGAYTGYEGVYRKIMGNPGEQEKALIQEVALAGWSGEQFASWLRSQDAYKYSPEGRSRAVSFLGELGLIFGAMPTAGPGGLPTGGIAAAGVPDDKRVAGAPVTPSQPTGTVGYGQG